MKCLYEFETIQDFMNFFESKNVLMQWDIREGTLKDRAKYLKGKKFFQNFKNQFKDNELYVKDVSNEEVVSWLDSLTILYRIFDSPFIEASVLNDAKVIMEYKIPFSNHQRADYIICVNNKMLILEFGSCLEKIKLPKKFRKKMQEAIGYKEMISNFVESSTKIGAYAICYLPETDVNYAVIEENSNINIKMYIEFGNVINEFFKVKLNAYEQLNDIESDELDFMSTEELQ